MQLYAQHILTVKHNPSSHICAHTLSRTSHASIRPQSLIHKHTPPSLHMLTCFPPHVLPPPQSSICQHLHHPTPHHSPSLQLFLFPLSPLHILNHPHAKHHATPYLLHLPHVMFGIHNLTPLQSGHAPTAGIIIFSVFTKPFVISAINPSTLPTHQSHLALCGGTLIISLMMLLVAPPPPICNVPR